jgi:hypothetical protein
MANRPNDPNPPAQPRHPGDRFRDDRDTNPERFRGVGEDSDDAMEDNEQFGESDDLDDDAHERDGSF